MAVDVLPSERSIVAITIIAAEIEDEQSVLLAPTKSSSSVDELAGRSQYASLAQWTPPKPVLR